MKYFNFSEFGTALQLEDVHVLDYNVWDTYVFDGHSLTTCEPKFSTNKGTFLLRPENATSIKNLILAGGYTKTDVDMFEMESAAESARRAVHILEESVPIRAWNRSFFFTPYRWLDSLFPKYDIYRRCPLLSFFLGIPLITILFLAYLMSNLF